MKSLFWGIGDAYPNNCPSVTSMRGYHKLLGRHIDKIKVPVK